MDLFERILHTRLGGTVERAHTVVHTGSYSVAAHSWGVAMLMLQLWPADFPRLASYCLTHDVPEGWVGDVPATIKRGDSLIKRHIDYMECLVFDRLMLPCDQDLSFEDKAKLRACDKVELYFWATEQLWQGNQHTICIIKALDSFFEADPLPVEAFELIMRLRSNLHEIPHCLTAIRTVL